jgi:hypothetical protein
MYLDSIFWFVAWPILVFGSYKIIAFLIEKYEAGKVE